MAFAKWLVVVGITFTLLSGCEPRATDDSLDEATQRVHEIDTLQLPTGNWALSNSIIQLSFCRDRINQALMAEQDELNRWRLVGDISVFPSNRAEGLQQLIAIYKEHGVLLYQVSGNFGSQIFRIAYRPNQPEPNIFNAFAKIGRDDSICYSSLDAN
ncbi:hypothetical protein [Pseudidiomarina sp.]|uniref:hypothetical protein n=1 Tax=Pseudidiomarina sp. TaxID=2081707 RepID=UPI003A96D92B